MADEATAAVRDPSYDPLAPSVIPDPYPFYRKLRETNSVHWHEFLDSWVVTGYAECRQVLGDTPNFSSDFRRIGVEIPDTQLSVRSLDPPEHGTIRHLLVSALHEQPLAAVGQQFATIAARQLSELSAHPGTVDMVSRFANCARCWGRCAPAGCGSRRPAPRRTSPRPPSVGWPSFPYRCASRTRLTDRARQRPEVSCVT